MRLLVLAASAAFFMPAPAQGAPSCASHDEALALLRNKYQERRVAVGVTSAGGLVEVLSSKDGGTWTILVTAPNGQSCIVSAGEGWRVVKPEEPEA